MPQNSVDKKADHFAALDFAANDSAALELGPGSMIDQPRGVFNRGDGDVNFRTVGWLQAAMIFLKSKQLSARSSYHLPVYVDRRSHICHWGIIDSFCYGGCRSRPWIHYPPCLHCPKWIQHHTNWKLSKAVSQLPFNHRYSQGHWRCCPSGTHRCSFNNQLYYYCFIWCY